MSKEEKISVEEINELNKKILDGNFEAKDVEDLNKVIQLEEVEDEELKTALENIKGNIPNVKSKIAEYYKVNEDEVYIGDATYTEGSSLEEFRNIFQNNKIVYGNVKAYNIEDAVMHYEPYDFEYFNDERDEKAWNELTDEEKLIAASRHIPDISKNEIDNAIVEDEEILYFNQREPFAKSSVEIISGNLLLDGSFKDIESLEKVEGSVFVGDPEIKDPILNNIMEIGGDLRGVDANSLLHANKLKKVNGSIINVEVIGDELEYVGNDMIDVTMNSNSTNNLKYVGGNLDISHIYGNMDNLTEVGGKITARFDKNRINEVVTQYQENRKEAGLEEDLHIYSVEELKDRVAQNDEKITKNDDLIHEEEQKQKLVAKLLEQQKTIAEQEKEMEILKSQREL